MKKKITALLIAFIIGISGIVPVEAGTEFYRTSFESRQLTGTATRRSESIDYDINVWVSGIATLDANIGFFFWNQYIVSNGTSKCGAINVPKGLKLKKDKNYHQIIFSATGIAIGGVTFGDSPAVDIDSSNKTFTIGTDVNIYDYTMKTQIANLVGYSETHRFADTLLMGTVKVRAFSIESYIEY